MIALVAGAFLVIKYVPEGLFLHRRSCYMLDARGAAAKEGFLTNNAERGRPDCVRYLLQHGANPNEGKDAGYTPLMAAAQFGHSDVARLLIRAGANVNFNSGGTPLCRALQNQSAGLPLVSLLVESGATLAWSTDSTALNCLADEKGRHDKFEYLISKGILQQMNTQQMAAALLGLRWDEVHELISQGINPNVRDTSGKTVLLRATRYNQCETVQFLLEHGADPSLKDDSSQTALELAMETRRSLRSANKNLPQLSYARDQNNAIVQMLLSRKTASSLHCAKL